MAASSLVPHEGWDRVFDEDMAFSALDIFPAEIFDHLKDPKDLKRARRVYKAWHGVLHKRRSLYTFSLVLPHLFPYLRKNDMVKCCEVASSWIIAVDDFHKFLDEYNKTPQTQLCFDYSKLTEFLATIGHPPSAPVNFAIYRNVIFRSPDTYYPKVMQYMARFGRLILNLRLVGSHPVSLDAMIRDWLCFATNMTVLYVSTTGVWGPINYQGPIKTLERFPLPDLPHLTHLSFSCTLPTTFNWLLLKYGGQLEKLELPVFGPNLEVMVPYQGVNFSRLQVLGMTLNSRNHIQQWRILLQTQGVQLTNLIVRYVSEVDATVASDMAEFINDFQRTLKELSVDYEFLENKVEFLEGLKVPRVKTMWLHDIGFPTPDLILSVAQSLSNLRLHFAGESDNEMYKKLYDEPEFWETLPSITSVYVELGTRPYEVYSYTRKRYVQAQEKKKEIRALVASVGNVLVHSPIIDQLFEER